MLALLFVLTTILNGYLLLTYFSNKKLVNNLFTYFLIGGFFSIPGIFSLSILLKDLNLALATFFVIESILFFVNFKKILRKILQSKFDKKVLLLNSLGFISFYLLFARSFTYDSSSNFFLIQTNLYQDFGAHIPIIRFFSHSNFTNPEVPFFAGKNLYYHFLFDFYIAIIEKLGLRIDICLNLISSITLLALLNILFTFSKLIFKSIFAGMIAFTFLVLTPDLSFLGLYKIYGIKILQWYHHNAYINNEFFGIGISKQFLYFNTYLNQRHLIFGICIFFFFLLLLYNQKNNSKVTILLALILGLFVFWHLQITITLFLLLSGSLILMKEKRLQILKIITFALPLAIPQILLIKMNSTNSVFFNPGFIISDNLSFLSFFLFWVWNLGFAFPLSILGIAMSRRSPKKIFLASLLIFAIPNLFQFSKDMFDNHKFFNVWSIIIYLFAGYYLSMLLKGKIIGKILVLFILLASIISGIMNLLVIKNDLYVKIKDPINSKFAQIVEKSIGAEDIILTNSRMYDPASILGKRIFLGNPRYVYLYGGDPDKRANERRVVLEGANDLKIREILLRNRISYIIIYKGKDSDLEKANIDKLNKKFKVIFKDNEEIIYKI